jgi:hypothetical protein
MHSNKELPPGQWLTLRSLKLGTTEQDVQDMLKESGIELSVDNIIMREAHPRFAQAIICLEKSHVAELFLRATQMNPDEVWWLGKGNLS